MYTYVQVCTQLQNVFASTRKIAKTARLANLRIHCDFPLFSLSFAKFARIARNHRVGDFCIFFCHAGDKFEIQLQILPNLRS